MIRLRRAVLCELAAVGAFVVVTPHFSLSAFAQSNEPAVLIRRCLDAAKADKGSATRFTYTRHEHLQYFNAKNKKTGEMTRLFEVLYLFDLEYDRLLEVNEKPLSGSVLEKEQKRYEAAYNERKGLNQEQRAALAKGKIVNVNMNLSRLLTGYDLRAMGHEEQSGRDCAVIDAMPKSVDSQGTSRHLTLWIDPVNAQLLKISFELLTDEKALLKGSKGSIVSTYIDGTSVDTEVHMDYLLVPEKKQKFSRLVQNNTLSNYKKFSISVRILPEDGGMAN